MNALYALLIACQLSSLSSRALTITFPRFERSAGALNGTVDNPVPPDCQQVCAPIVPFAIGGQSCTPSLCCSSRWEQSYYSCIVCAARAQDITDFTTAQTTLDGINADCAASGINTPQLTFPGQPANRTLPSASILPSDSASVTLSGTASSTASGAPGNSGSASGTATLTGIGASGISTTSTASPPSGSSTSSSSTSSSSASSPTQSKNTASSIQIRWSIFIVLCTTIAVTLL